MSYEYEQDMNGNGLYINDWGGSDATVRVTFERGNYVAVYLPSAERCEAAQALAGDDYRVVPNEGPTRGQVMDALGITDFDDVVPAIERLKSTANMPDWERELLAGQAAQQEIDQLKRDYDALEKRLREAEARDQYPRVQGVCPSCGVGPLFRAEEGLITCSWVDCKEPDAASNLLAEPPKQPDPLDPLRRKLHEPDRPEPVDPSEVRKGDYVSIELTWPDGTPRWRVDSPVEEVHHYNAPHSLTIRDEEGEDWQPDLTDATVRVLHRAEPDPAAVAEIRQIVRDFLRPNGSPDGLTDSEVIRLAQALAGVHVEVPTDE